MYSKYLYLSVILVCSVFTSGCGTITKSLMAGKYSEVADTFRSLEKGKTRIFVYYPGGVSIGAAFHGSLAIDNQVLRFQRGTFSFVDVNSGQHALCYAASARDGLFKQKWVTAGNLIEFKTEENEKLFIRLKTENFINKTVSYGINPDLKEAEKEIGQLYYDKRMTDFYANHRTMIGDRSTE